MIVTFTRVYALSITSFCDDKFMAIHKPFLRSSALFGVGCYKSGRINTSNSISMNNECTVAQSIIHRTIDLEFSQRVQYADPTTVGFGLTTLPIICLPLKKSDYIKIYILMYILYIEYIIEYIKILF